MQFTDSDRKNGGEGMSEQYPISLYKKLICEMIMDMNNDRFIKQIYSIIYNERKRGALR